MSMDILNNFTIKARLIFIIDLPLCLKSKSINEVTIAQGTTVNATELLPGDRSFYHYSGSLTTPPCSENVNWFVMKTPIQVSDQQVHRFARLIGENSRPLQEMHWRTMFGSR